MSRTRKIVMNIMIAATVGVAALASWAVTLSNAPLIEAYASTHQRG